MVIEVIGIAGGAGVGKDYIVKRYFEPRGYKGVAFADPLKSLLIGRGVMTFEEAHTNPKPESVRKALVAKGEGDRATYGEDVWIKMFMADVRRFEMRFGLTRFVVTDARRPFEVEAVKAQGGKVYLVHAPDRWAANGLDDAGRAASTEIFAAQFEQYKQLFDGIIYNDPQDADSLDAQMNALLGPATISAKIRLGVTDATAPVRPETRSGIHGHTLEPLCLTCGPKNIVWMGPVVQMCGKCQAEFDAWQTRTVAFGSGSRGDASHD